MKEFKVVDIVAATGGDLVRGSLDSLVKNVVHDSRAVSEGSAFFAIIGENTDGHQYINDAIEAGASVVVVSELPSETGVYMVNAIRNKVSVIKVADTKLALGQLAAWYIKEIGATVIGVTGSTGKTSTKDMMCAVAGTKYVTGKTQGNFNNELGMPLTILGFDEDIEIAVLEMGMDHFGDIDYLVNIAAPKIALITNIGISHMENLGSREGIFKAKMEITTLFDEENKLIISKGADYLRKQNIQGEFEVISTGIDDDNDYVISDIEESESGLSFRLSNGIESQDFKLPVHGKHNALNASLAIAAGMKLGIPMSMAAKGLSEMTLTKGRLSMKKLGNLSLIDDTYNASPDSMRAALDVLSELAGEKKVAILGDMYELGVDSQKWHRIVGEYAAEKATTVVAIGDNAKFIAEGAAGKGHYFESKAEFLESIDEYLADADIVLVKASRGMKMEEIVHAIEDIKE